MEAEKSTEEKGQGQTTDGAVGREEKAQSSSSQGVGSA